MPSPNESCLSTPACLLKKGGAFFSGRFRVEVIKPITVMKVLACLTLPEVRCGSSMQGEATWCLARGNPVVSVGIEEADMVHCRF